MKKFLKLQAYHDSKSSYGYMVICPDCLKNAPKWVDTSEAIPNFEFNDKECEMCKRPGQQDSHEMGRLSS